MKNDDEQTQTTRPLSDYILRAGRAHYVTDRVPGCRDWEGEYKTLSRALVGATGASAIEEAGKHAIMRRAAEALKSFPLPSQNLTATENYRRVLAWLYRDGFDPATLIIELEFGKEIDDAAE